MSLTNVAIVGANGNLGPFVIKALLSASFKVTVLTRESSKSTYASTVNVAKIPDSFPHDPLVSALKDHDAVVISVGSEQSELSLKVIAAAHAANVKRIIPSDFGSCDSTDPRSLALIPLYPEKTKVRNHLISLAKQTNGALSWTSIVCGHFLDYGLQTRLMQFDMENHKAIIFDGGDIKFSASMLRTVGETVVAVLQRPEQTKDRIVYVQSISTTQNKLLKAVENVVGTKFEVVPRDSEDFIKELKKVLEDEPGQHEATEDLVGVEGMVNADWTTRKDFANEELGLPDEDLEALVRESLGK